MKISTVALSTCFLSILLLSCSREQKAEKPLSQPTTNVPSPVQKDTTKVQTQPPLPTSDRYYVLDKRQKIIFGIDLSNNKIAQRFIASDNVVGIAYDMGRDWIYEAIGPPRPGLKILDPKTGKFVQGWEFAEPPSDLFFHPIKKLLFITSEDSTYFRVFSPDSMKFLYSFPLWITDKGFIGPRVMGPGPAGKLIMANGPRASVTEIFTDNQYVYQTIIIHEAKCIDNAAFAFDGNSCFVCDSKQGKIFRVEFGSGKVMAKKEGLDNPRFIQIEVQSNTVVVVTGKNQVQMLHPDTFVEMGKVDLGQYGDNILSLVILPKANYAEVLMDYKGVARWIRFDLDHWEALRLVELI